MSKFLLSLSFVFAAVFPRYANAIDSQAPSIFQKLAAQFDTGTVIDFKAVTGKLDSGRCFSAKTPDFPLAAYLVAELRTLDAGSVSQPVQSVVAHVGVFEDLDPAYFDSVAISDSQIETVRTPLSMPDNHTYLMTLDNGATVAFRGSGNTIVASGESPFGEALLMCYFFNIH